MKAKTSCIIVLISDTQDAHLYIGSLSDRDVLFHAGDFTRRRPPARNEKEYRRFKDWFSRQSHQHKIVIKDQYMAMVMTSPPYGEGDIVEWNVKI